ncbi:hypothetical protein NQ315_008624 [Exocentrus adspersus]|uniref:Myb/SANT-like DNA-binding domain-containing protein n=1 Tax=Exocentrus adspersus TaxID=1586481 RepID=A0AAV8W6L5_9CUCU|nr:hypothetical protein NQ315_008624 [Exocentrus adspersus]
METEADPIIPKQEIFPLKSTKFDPQWVQVLINLRMKHSKMFTKRRNSASEGWKLVFDELQESGAPEYVTITKIKKKWMNLMTRYRQIKNTTLNPETITWPYYEQIDRAFGKEPDLDFEGRIDNSLNHSVNNDERQNFIKKLIELRYSHRHLFTGRKYTARDGWMIIQSLLQCQGKYSIDQLSKCWQNLVQRYKQLVKSEADTISWPYYECMQKWFKDEPKINDKAKIEENASINVIDGEDSIKTDVSFVNNVHFLPKNSISIDCAKIQLLTEMKAAQEKYHNEVMEALKGISEHLNLSTAPSNIIINNDKYQC